MLLGGIDFLKFSWLLLYLDMSLLYAIGIMKSLTTATEMTCIQIDHEITLLFLLCSIISHAESTMRVLLYCTQLWLTASLKIIHMYSRLKVIYKPGVVL